MKIIAEIGINFNGEIELAKKLIDIASNAKCDFAKFQLFRADSFYPKSAGKLDWFDGKKKYSYDIYEAVKKFELPFEWLDELVEYSNKKNIKFLASVFNFDDLEIYKSLGLDSIKLASYSITNLPLIEEVAKTGMHIFLSTGGSFLGEVDEAVRLIRKYRNNFTLMHCSIAYPTPLDKVNMGIIETFKNAFDCEVGYSDHTAEIYEAPLQAKLLGASVIEKHITFDKNAEGPDHFFALDERELKIMVEKLKKSNIKLDKKIYGSTQRICYSHEEYLRNFAYHQLFVNRDIKKGEIITQKDISILRRGKKEKGLKPKYWNLFENGVTSTCDLKKEDVLTWDKILKKENNKFDEWNYLKQEINDKENILNFKERDIFFVSFGQNIGYEIYGKGEEFLRPVVVLKKYSKYTFLVIPLTSKIKNDKFHFIINFKNRINSAILTQARAIDIRRAKYKIGEVRHSEFKKLKKRYLDFITPKKGDGSLPNNGATSYENIISKEE